MIKYWDTFFQGAISISEWCRVESVPTPRFQQTLYWFEASAKKISTISSFPLPEPPPPTQPICVGCHMQPSEPPADWDQGRLLQPAVWVGWLPSPLTCAAQKCGWIMEKCSQEGFFFLSLNSVCMETLQSPTQQVSSPKRCPTAHRNIDVQLRFSCRNAAKLTTWLLWKRITHFSAVA